MKEVKHIISARADCKTRTGCLHKVKADTFLKAFHNVQGVVSNEIYFGVYKPLIGNLGV